MPITPRYPIAGPDNPEYDISASEHNAGVTFTGGDDGALIVRDSEVAAGGYAEVPPAEGLLICDGAGPPEYLAPTPGGVLVCPASGPPVFTAAPAEGQVLTGTAEGESDWATPAPHAWQAAVKSADESKGHAGALVLDDADLQFEMAANTKYRIRACIFYEIDNHSFANRLYHRWLGPAAPTFVQGVAVHSQNPFSNNGARFLSAFDGADQNVPGYSGTNDDNRGMLQLDMIVHNGANAGTFKFGWDSGSSQANSATVRAGSYIEYQAVA